MKAVATLVTFALAAFGLVELFVLVANQVQSVEPEWAKSVLALSVVALALSAMVALAATIGLASQYLSKRRDDARRSYADWRDCS